MTATQSKALITAARNVLAILPAGTDGTLTALQAALEAAEAPAKAKADKWIKPSRRPGYGYYKPWDRALETLDEYCHRVEQGFRDRSGLGKVTMMEGAARIDQDAIRARLSRCACGHAAAEHREDENANLLECRNPIHRNALVPPCDHFHYQIDDKEEAQAA